MGRLLQRLWAPRSVYSSKVSGVGGSEAVDIVFLNSDKVGKKMVWK